MVNSYIPGVYTSLEMSGIKYKTGAPGVVGIALYDGSLAAGVTEIASPAAATAKFGAKSVGEKLISLIFQNGASSVKAAVTADDTKNGYAAAFALLMKEPDIYVITCDSTEADVLSALLAAISSGDESTKYRIGVVEGAGNTAALKALAAGLNSQRMIITTPVKNGGMGTAAALAGMIAGTADPALPFGGAELAGVTDELEEYTDDELNALIGAGVTPVRREGTAVCVVRAVTTRTKSGGTPDVSWRDVNTVLIADNVITQVRGVLKGMFSRAKNTLRTRGAVRTQVVIELEKKLDAGIIDGYGDVSVTQDENDPAVCLVSFEFSPASGMHQIIISAYITI